MLALRPKDMERLTNDMLTHEWVNAWNLNRRFYDEQDRELIAAEYKKRSMPLPPFAIYQDEPTGLWVVAIPSPTAKSGYIVHTERASEQEAWQDAREFAS
jgi:hypothetical protein